MIKVEILRTQVLILGLSFVVHCASFKGSPQTADIYYPAAPYLTKRAGIGNETLKQPR